MQMFVEMFCTCLKQLKLKSEIWWLPMHPFTVWLVRYLLCSPASISRCYNSKLFHASYAIFDFHLDTVWIFLQQFACWVPLLWQTSAEQMCLERVCQRSEHWNEVLQHFLPQPGNKKRCYKQIKQWQQLHQTLNKKKEGKQRQTFSAKTWRGQSAVQR